MQNNNQQKTSITQIIVLIVSVVFICISFLLKLSRIPSDLIGLLLVLQIGSYAFLALFILILITGIVSLAKRKRNAPLLLIVSLAILLLPLIIYKYIRYDVLEGSSQAGQTLKKIETRNWKTYDNEDFGFRIKYPKSLSIEEVKSIHLKEFVLINDNQSSPDLRNNLCNAKYFLFIDKLTGTLKDFTTTNRIFTSIGVGNSSDETQKKGYYSEIWYEADSRGDYSDKNNLQSIFTVVFNNKDDRLVTIGECPVYPKRNASISLPAEFEKILSTFEFTK